MQLNLDETVQHVVRTIQVGRKRLMFDRNDATCLPKLPQSDLICPDFGRTRPMLAETHPKLAEFGSKLVETLPDRVELAQFGSRLPQAWSNLTQSPRRAAPTRPVQRPLPTHRPRSPALLPASELRVVGKPRTRPPPPPSPFPRCAPATPRAPVGRTSGAARTRDPPAPRGSSCSATAASAHPNTSDAQGPRARPPWRPLRPRGCRATAGPAARSPTSRPPGRGAASGVCPKPPGGSSAEWLRPCGASPSG